MCVIGVLHYFIVYDKVHGGLAIYQQPPRSDHFHRSLGLVTFSGLSVCHSLQG